ncbi:MAG: DUF2286 domain-containing protein [Desulfurococcales archaeon]|nr:DUF2286 domain-containing protein [Desulfurococcales archaeon]
MSGKWLVVEAVRGRVVESRVVEGDMAGVVKGVVREAVEKWDPTGGADFVVTRDDREWDLEGEEREIVDWLEGLGVVEEVDGRRVARIPFFLVSYDNKSFGDTYYEEYGIYIITLYIGEDYRVMVEEFAASITTSSKEG